MKRSVIGGKKPFVRLPLTLWEQLEDILEELSSPKLLRSIRSARKDYKIGRGISYEKLREGLKLS